MGLLVLVWPRRHKWTRYTDRYRRDSLFASRVPDMQQRRKRLAFYEYSIGADELLLYYD